MPRFALALTTAAAVFQLCAGAAGAAGAARAASPPLLFWSDTRGPSLWSVRPDGSGRVRISRQSENAKRPALSPDGRRIAFEGARPGPPPMRDFDILLMRPNGSGVRALTSGATWDIDARWSADGRTLTFSRMPAGAD